MPKTITIIEDEPTLIDIYKMIFEDAGFKVETAADGDSGLEILRETNPDIALVDLMLPYVNGDELITKVRKTKWGKDLKIIVLTNVGNTATTAKLKKMGVLEVVTKVDVSPDELVNLVKSHL